MRTGDLETVASLNRTDAPYSFQEDVYLNVTFKNLGGKHLSIPYLLEHAATYTLKDKLTGAEKVVAYAAPASPGTGAPEAHPEAAIESGESVTYKLLLQFPLGFIPAGDHSLQLKVDFPALPIATDWLDFQVRPQAVGDYTFAPSSAGPSERLYMAWCDLAAKPARLLFQRSYIGEQKPLVARTFAFAEAESPATPVTSMSPPGEDADAAWVAWITKGKLGFSRITAKDEVKTATLPLPEKTAWTLVPNLAYSQGADGKDSILSGLLLGRDEKGFCFSAFALGGPAGPVWLPAFRPSPGEILAAKLVPLSAHRRALIWARYQGAALTVEALDWDDAQGLGKTVLPCGSFPMAAKAFKSLDAVAQAPGIQWGLALHDEAPEGKPSNLRLITHSVILTDLGKGPSMGSGPGLRTGPGIPKTRNFPAHPGPLQVTLKLDVHGKPWLLQRDAHGAWVQSPENETPVVVETPRGSSREDLFFRNGTVPKVMLLDPDSGFTVKSVPEAGAAEE